MHCKPPLLPAGIWVAFFSRCQRYRCGPFSWPAASALHFFFFARNSFSADPISIAIGSEYCARAAARTSCARSSRGLTMHCANWTSKRNAQAVAQAVPPTARRALRRPVQRLRSSKQTVARATQAESARAPTSKCRRVLCPSPRARQPERLLWRPRARPNSSSSGSCHYWRPLEVRWGSPSLAV